MTSLYSEGALRAKYPPHPRLDRAAENLTAEYSQTAPPPFCGNIRRPSLLCVSVPVGLSQAQLQRPALHARIREAYRVRAVEH